MDTTCQIVVTAGPFRLNSRCRVTCEEEAEDLARITFHNPEFTTEVVLADSHLEAFADALNAMVSSRRNAARLRLADTA